MESNKSAQLEQFALDEEFFLNFASLHTRTAYRSDLVKFIDYLQLYHPEVKNFAEVDRIHLISHRNFLATQGGRKQGPGAPKAIARKISALASYFDYLVERGWRQFNPTQAIRRPRKEVRTPTEALSGTQVAAILASINQDRPAGILHYALLVTFFSTGLRKSEILSLKRRNYRRINGHDILEYCGKGGKLDQKLLHPWCVMAINNYLTQLEGMNRTMGPDDPLFRPTRNHYGNKSLNRAFNPKTINELMSHYAQKIGIDFRVTPHSARASFITELLAAGVDIYSVAQEVNHSSVTTTQTYDKRRRKLINAPVRKLRYLPESS